MDKANTGKRIVLLHGLWLNTWTMWLLKSRLQHAGFEVSVFGYRSVVQDLKSNAADLSTWLVERAGPIDGFVAHSLGGITLRALFYYFPPEFNGRVVTLGTPHLGSLAGRRLNERVPGRYLIGKSMGQFLGENPIWPAPPGEWGCIAGCLSAGIGRLVIRQGDGSSDGTVLVDEALAPFAVDRKVLRVSHFGLLFSPRVAREAIHFLRHGQFLH